MLSLLENNTGALRDMLFTLLAAVALLLLIACANVANLLLARATARNLRARRARRRALADRAPVARRGPRARALRRHRGRCIGTMGTRHAIAPPNLPRVAEIALDGRAVAASVAITLITGLGFALVPAWQGSRVNLVDALKDGARARATAAVAM